MLKKYSIILLGVSLSFAQSALSNSSLYSLIMKGGDLKKVKELVLSGKTKIDEGDVAVAALKGHVEIVEFFLSKRAPLDSEVMRSAVRGACENKKRSKAYEEIIRMLVQVHAPFDKETLCMAIECGNMTIVKMLVDAMPAFNNAKPLTRLRSA